MGTKYKQERSKNLEKYLNCQRFLLTKKVIVLFGKIYEMSETFHQVYEVCIKKRLLFFKNDISENLIDTVILKLKSNVEEVVSTTCFC